MNPYITYWPNGHKCSEQWSVEEKSHRVDGPSYQSWYYNGQKYSEQWWVEGQRHRVDGPAYQNWNLNGQKLGEEWFIGGIEYDTIQNWVMALVELGYKTKSQALFLLLKWK